MAKRKLSAGLAAYNARRKAGQGKKIGKTSRVRSKAPKRKAKKKGKRAGPKRALSPGLLAYMAAKRNGGAAPERKAKGRRSTAKRSPKTLVSARSSSSQTSRPLY